MNIPAKLFHIFKQALIFLILPFVVFASNFRKSCEHCFPCNYFIRQSQIPVNRFLYWEMSKLLFYAIVMATLVDETDYTWYDMITILWIASNLLETFRTIHRYILSLRPQLVVGTTSQNTPHHTTFPPHHMWCGDFLTKFYSCGVGGGVGCVEKICVMWGVVWGACKKYM